MFGKPYRSTQSIESLTKSFFERGHLALFLLFLLIGFFRGRGRGFGCLSNRQVSQWSSIGSHDPVDAEEGHRDGKVLAHGCARLQDAEVSIGLSEKFDDKP